MLDGLIDGRRSPQIIKLASAGMTMTEAEWLASGDPAPMLEFLRGQMVPKVLQLGAGRTREVQHYPDAKADRKLRLFACACCRRMWEDLTDDRSRKAIEAAERFADRQISQSQLKSACGAARKVRTVDISDWSTHDFSRDALYQAVQAAHEVARSAQTIPSRAQLMARLPDGIVQRVISWAEASNIPRSDELARLAAFLRDIFRNPARPLPPRPEAGAPLAEKIYAGDWALIPYLGEWLQEHGYWSEGEHCLDPNIQHVKGCWVVDWVTGRE
jgi:hypothetical protein